MRLLFTNETQLDTNIQWWLPKEAKGLFRLMCFSESGLCEIMNFDTYETHKKHNVRFQIPMLET